VISRLASLSISLLFVIDATNLLICIFAYVMGVWHLLNYNTCLIERPLGTKNICLIE